MQKNEEYIVEIIDNGYKGEGIAKINNMPIFIPKTIKGEKVKIKVLKVLKNEAYGKALQIVEPSEFRREIDCSTYSKCGGCNLRHINYKETLNMKKAIVQNNMKKAGLYDVLVKDCIGMENPFYYRNKLQYPVGYQDGRTLMGVFAERSHRIIETKECMLQNKLLQEIAEHIFSFILENNIPVYDEEKQEGEIRHIYLRIGIKTNEVMAVLVTNKQKITKEDELVDYIITKYAQVKTIVKNINPKSTNVILGKENIVLYGTGYIEDELLGYRFKISPMSFYQVNPIQTEKLYLKAIKEADLKGNETIFDLYCGIGTIGICASKYAKKLYGIETIKEAIEDAKENADINNIKNAEFIVGNVEEELPKLLEKEKINPDVVFLDPPRKGCDKVALDTLLKLRPQKIVYISCNSATLARDLKILSKEYEINGIIPVDMFPFTAHVECVALMGRKES